MRKLAFLCMFFLGLAGPVSAQGLAYREKLTTPGGGAVRFPLVTVCTSAASLAITPCTPTTTIYSDATLTTTLANPLIGSANGDVEFYVPRGTYVLSVTRPFSPGYTKKFDVGYTLSGTGSIGYINVKDTSYAGGAKGDGQEVVDAVVAATSVVTSATANFITNAKVGQLVWGVEDATGLARLPQGTIVSIQSQTQITVSTTGAGSFSSIRLRWGTDDTAALVAATTATIATGKRSTGLGTMYLPAGDYICNKAVATSCLDFVTGGPYNSVMILGDSPNASVIWTTPGITMNADLSGNMLAILGHDFTVENMGFDGGRFASGVSNKVAVSTASGTVGTLTDSTPNLLFNVHISQWQTVAGGTNCGLYLGAARTVVLNSAIEQNNCGGYAAGGNFSSINTLWSNNNNGFNLKCDGVQDYPTGGCTVSGRSTVDESGTFLTGAFQCLNTSDCVLADSTFYGPTGGISIRVDGTSRATISNSRVTPYSADNNGTGLSILAGGIVSATNTKFRSSGTGVAVNNAGTFIDACGNTVDIASGTGGITNTGTLKNCSTQPMGGVCLLTSAASPLACGTAGQGRVAIPISQATYTINTNAIEANSRVVISPTTSNSGIPGAPTCVAPITTVPVVSAQTAKTSFVITQTSQANITCFDWVVMTP